MVPLMYAVVLVAAEPKHKAVSLSENTIGSKLDVHELDTREKLCRAEWYARVISEAVILSSSSS